MVFHQFVDQLAQSGLGRFDHLAVAARKDDVYLGFPEALFVRVNAIAPGPTDTDAARSVVPGSIMDDIVKGLALKRRGTPEDMAGMVSFLLSDDASWITGQIFNVDGGQVVRP